MKEEYSDNSMQEVIITLIEKTDAFLKKFKDQVGNEQLL